MARTPLLSATALVLFGAAACNGLLNISPPGDGDGDGDDDGDGGKAGSAGAGNAPGSGGSSAGRGGAGEGGAGAESIGGSSAGVQATGGTGGVSGAAGAAGGPPTGFPVAGEPCSTPGALACQMAASIGRLICNGNVWEETDECTLVNRNPALCDRRTGACGEILCPEPGVPAYDNACAGRSYMACGPDRVTLVRVECVLKCLGNERCETPNSDQLIIDEALDFEAGNQAWPDPVVPVCWSDWADSDLVVERAAVRRAVDSSWGRYSALSFTGWGSCLTEESRVELRFVDDCQGELVRLSRPGYPGPRAAASVDLCKTYYNNDRPPLLEHELDVLALAAKHVFGHVLGFVDEQYDPGVLVVMVPVIELPNYHNVGFRSADIAELRERYGPKPARALVGPDGRCLDYVSPELTGAGCDGSPAQAWQPGGDGIRHVESGECLSDAGGLAACDALPSPAWKLSSVRIRERAGECLVRGGTFPRDASLVLQACKPEWPEGERFEIEFPEPGGARIHTTLGRCITAPLVLTSLPIPVPGFGPCDGDRDVFEVFEGTLSQRGYCLAVDRGSIVFEPCVGDAPQQFWFSGPLELGGSALELIPSDAGGVLSSAALGPVPTAEQIFDYQF